MPSLALLQLYCCLYIDCTSFTTYTLHVVSRSSAAVPAKSCNFPSGRSELTRERQLVPVLVSGNWSRAGVHLRSNCKAAMCPRASPVAARTCSVERPTVCVGMDLVLYVDGGRRVTGCWERSELLCNCPEHTDGVLAACASAEHAHLQSSHLGVHAVNREARTGIVGKQRRDTKTAQRFRS